MRPWQVELSSDARFQVESDPGLTDFEGSLMQRGRNHWPFYWHLFFCTGYWFTRSSRLPRPASPASTSVVETVHPQYKRLSAFSTVGIGIESHGDGKQISVTRSWGRKAKFRHPFSGTESSFPSLCSFASFYLLRGRTKLPQSTPNDPR